MTPPAAPYEVQADLPATLEAIEHFVAVFRRRPAGPTIRGACFAAELMLREALTNAVVHGSKGDPGRRVRCRVRVKGRRLTIAVSQEGDGFDWRSAWNREPGDSSSSGRGIAILRRYASRVRFNRGGNSVTIVQQF